MKITKSKRNNIFFLIVIALLIIPQTRQPIQIVLHKGLALFGPSIVAEDERKAVTNYNWELKDLNGDTFNLNEIEGKVVLINFWATWCPPCIAEMPSLQKLHDDYKDRISILFVSNEEREAIQRFLDKKDYNFNVYQPISNVPETLKSRSIPRTFLLDKKGNIVIDKSGAADWNSEKVRRQIDALLPQ